jgi:hypothetical protein
MIAAQRAGRWRRAAPWAALAMALSIGALAVRTPEPARSAFALVASVCSERSPQERRRQLAQHVAERLTLEIEDEEQVWPKQHLSPVELLARLEELDLAWPRCQLQLQVTGVRSAGDGSEWLEGELEFSDSQAGDLHAELRSVQAQFRTSGEGRRLEHVRLGAPERRLPEARP